MIAMMAVAGLVLGTAISIDSGRQLFVDDCLVAFSMSNDPGGML